MLNERVYLQYECTLAELLQVCGPAYTAHTRNLHDLLNLLPPSESKAQRIESWLIFSHWKVEFKYWDMYWERNQQTGEIDLYCLK